MEKEMEMGRSRIASFTLAGLVALLLASPDADARERQERARMGAPKSGHAERSVTRTRPDGTTRTSSHDSTWQRGDGKYSRDTVHTGPGGKTATTHDEVQRTEDGYTRATTHTGPNGGVTTRNATGGYDPATKTWTKDVTRTNPNGSTATTHVDGQRTDDGYTKTSTHTGPQGGVTTRSATGAYDPDTKTWTREKVVTRPDGSTAKTDVTTKVTPEAPDPALAE